MQSLNNLDESCHLLPLDYQPRPSDIDWTGKYSGDVVKLMQDKKSGVCAVPPEGVIIYSVKEGRYVACGVQMDRHIADIVPKQTGDESTNNGMLSQMSSLEVSPYTSPTLPQPINRTQFYDRMNTSFPQLNRDENNALEKEGNENSTIAAAVPLPLRIEKKRSVRLQDGDGPRPHRLKMLAMKELRRGSINVADYQDITSQPLKPGLKLHTGRIRKRPSDEVKLALYELSAGSIGEKEYSEVLRKHGPAPESRPSEPVAEKPAVKRVWARRSWTKRVGRERPVAFWSHALRASEMVKRRQSICDPSPTSPPAEMEPNHQSESDPGSVLDRIRERRKSKNGDKKQDSLTKQDLIEACGISEDMANILYKKMRGKPRIVRERTGLSDDADPFTDMPPAECLERASPPNSPGRTRRCSNNVSRARAIMLQTLDLETSGDHTRHVLRGTEGESSMHLRRRSCDAAPGSHSQMESDSVVSSLDLQKYARESLDIKRDDSHFLDLDDFVSFTEGVAPQSPSCEGPNYVPPSPDLTRKAPSTERPSDAPPGLGFTPTLPSKAAKTDISPDIVIPPTPLASPSGGSSPAPPGLGFTPRSSLKEGRASVSPSIRIPAKPMSGGGLSPAPPGLGFTPRKELN